MKKIFLYLSAFVPLYFLVIVKILVDIILGNLHFNVLNTLTLILLCIAIGFGIFGAIKSVEHNDTQTSQIQIKKCTAITEKYFLGYFSLFVLFALTFELERVSMFIVFILVIILIGIVYIKNDLFYINPFLNILGYNFYDITYIDTTGKEASGKFLIKGEINNKNGEVKAKLSHENFSLILK
ncbi:MAG: hypothetical protein KBT30_02630 [Clostridiales bacterium]|nr:hypothetical protein [Candidatus Apopatousia equi]